MSEESFVFSSPIFFVCISRDDFRNLSNFFVQFRHSQVLKKSIWLGLNLEEVKPRRKKKKSCDFEYLFCLSSSRENFSSFCITVMRNNSFNYNEQIGWSVERGCVYLFMTDWDAFLKVHIAGWADKCRVTFRFVLRDLRMKRNAQKLESHAMRAVNFHLLFIQLLSGGDCYLCDP